MLQSNVSALYALEFAKYAASRDVILAPGIAAREHEAAVRRMRGEDFCQHMSEAVKLAGDPDLGMQFGAAVGGRGFGLLGIVTAAAPTLAQSLRSLQRWEPLSSTLGSIRISRSAKHLRVSWLSLPGVPAAAVEAALSGWVSFGRFMVGENLPVVSMEFAHSRPRRDAESIVRCPVRFNAGENAIVVPIEVLDARSRYADQLLHGSISGWLDDGMQLLTGGGENFFADLTDAILDGLHRGDVHAAAIATRLGFTQRTLQRQLASRGLSYRRALELVRASIALTRLCDGASALDSAHLAGFEEQATLSRVVRRWTGRTPREIGTWFGRDFAALRD